MLRPNTGIEPMGRFEKHFMGRYYLITGWVDMKMLKNRQVSVHMAKIKWMAVLCLLGLMSWPVTARTCQAATLTYTCNNFLPQFQRCDQFVHRWSKATGNKVQVREKLWVTNDELAFIQHILTTGASEPNILMVDIIWTEMLANYLVDLNAYLSDQTKDLYFDKLIANNTDSKGRLVSLPFFTAVGMLFYREDLLAKYHRPVPDTWEELAATAAYIVSKEKGDHPDLVGFVWQGRAYEGLTCAALEWIDSYGGGTIVAPDGHITVNNPKAKKALQTAKSWIGSISPPEVLDYSELEARMAFESGNAVFMRGWPFMWRNANYTTSKVKGRVGVAPIPKGGDSGKHSGTLGGWNLAVSLHSPHPDIAADLCRFMASPDIQLERSEISGVVPTLKHVDPNQSRSLQKALPFLNSIPRWIDHAVARPSKVTGAKYGKVSKKFWKAVHAVLSGRLEVGEALGQLEEDLRRIKGQGWHQGTLFDAEP